MKSFSFRRIHKFQHCTNLRSIRLFLLRYCTDIIMISTSNTRIAITIPIGKIMSIPSFSFSDCNCTDGSSVLVDNVVVRAGQFDSSSLKIQFLTPLQTEEGGIHCFVILHWYPLLQDCSTIFLGMHVFSSLYNSIVSGHPHLKSSVFMLAIKHKCEQPPLIL